MMFVYFADERSVCHVPNDEATDVVRKLLVGEARVTHANEDAALCV